MGCSDYGIVAKSAGMATTVRVPRERQFHVVPVPGVFTRGRWKCRDYREDDHPDSRDQILDFTDIRERGEGGGEPANAVEKPPQSSHERPTEVKPIPESATATDPIPSPLKESSTIVVTSIAPAPPTPQHNNHHAEATERAIRELERGNLPKMSPLDTECLHTAQFAVAQGTSTGANSPVEEEIPPSGNGAPVAAPNVVAIDNKIEQAMDLVKTHLTFAVREEVEVLRQTIAELEQRVSSLENENQLLRQYAPGEVLNNIAALVQQRKASNNPVTTPAQHPTPSVPPK
ncbi:hypothetical protein V3C99_018751, partial [Haemonchus contortus]